MFPIFPARGSSAAPAPVLQRGGLREAHRQVEEHLEDAFFCVLYCLLSCVCLLCLLLLFVSTCKHLEDVALQPAPGGAAPGEVRRALRQAADGRDHLGGNRP